MGDFSSLTSIILGQIHIQTSHLSCGATHSFSHFRRFTIAQTYPFEDSFSLERHKPEVIGDGRAWNGRFHVVKIVQIALLLIWGAAAARRSLMSVFARIYLTVFI